MLAAEILPDIDLHYVLDFALLGHSDVAPDAWSANQYHERQFEHLAVIKQETHLRQGARVALDELWIPQIYRIIVNQAGRLEVLLRINLNMVDLEAGVGAVELVLGAAPALQLVYTLA